MDYKALIREFDAIVEKRNKQVKKVKRKRNKCKKVISPAESAAPLSMYSDAKPEPIPMSQT